MPKEASITPEVISHYGMLAAERKKKQDLTVEDFVELADEAREAGKYYAAAVFYRIASMKAAPSPESYVLHERADEMQDMMGQDEED